MRRLEQGHLRVTYLDPESETVSGIGDGDDRIVGDDLDACDGNALVRCHRLVLAGEHEQSMGYGDQAGATKAIPPPISGAGAPPARDPFAVPGQLSWPREAGRTQKPERSGGYRDRHDLKLAPVRHPNVGTDRRQRNNARGFPA